jgi:prepilin-type processing-associated H-X9-DG protein
MTDGTSKQFIVAETRYQITALSEQAWAIVNPTFYVGRVSYPSWAATSRQGVSVGPNSTVGAAVNSINSSSFVDTSAAPVSCSPCSSEMLTTFGSYHPGGCNIAFADGSVQFVSQMIDINLYRQLGSRADGNASRYNP